MKRHFLLWVALVLTAQMSWGVDPSVTLTSYYAGIDGKATDSNDALRVQLCTIISTGYTSIGYSSLPDNVYAASSDPSDFYNGSSKTMEDIYSSKAYTSSQSGSSATTCGTGWNKEHTVPQSWFNENAPMKSDAHHVFPTDIKMNSVRSSYPYGENNASKSCSDYGYGHLGTSTFPGYTGQVFDPGTKEECGGKCYRGDLARVYFYMATRYRTTNFTNGSGGTSFTYSNGVADLTDYMKNLMLKWHREDPVSEKELIRNNAIYAHQKNRNPFVDYPCLVEYIWGEHKGESVELSALISGYSGEGTDCCSGGGGGTIDPIPADYYTPVEGLKDSLLKSRLAELTWAHYTKVYSYGSGSNHTWEAFWETDRNEADNSVIDMYSNNKRYFNPDNTTASVNNCDIEHMFPNSWFGGESGNKHAYCDLNHLVPADFSANRSKGNRGPGVPTDSTFNNGVWVNGTDANRDNLSVFCPPNEYKGDFARAFFYIATTYGDTAIWQAEAVPNHMTNADWHELLPATLKLLLRWHRQDPVSEKELIRNNTVYKLQGNRNPFIDYPCLVEYIWGTLQGEEFDLSCSDLPTPKYTITWSVNGATSSNQVIADVKPTAPSVQDCSTDRVFVGWTTNSTVSGTKPTILYKSNEIPNATEEATYYAVFADKEGEGTGSDYTLFTGTLTEGDYIIYYGGKAMKAEVSNSRLAYTEVSPSGNTISSPNANIIWHIAKSGDYWTIYNESVKKYAASTGAANKAQLLTSGTDDKSLWTANGSSTYEFVNKDNTAKSVNANLRNNGTYGFACYATGTGGALSLYKAASTVTYSNYGLLCEDCTPEKPVVGFEESAKSTTCGGVVSNVLDKGGSAGAVTYTSSNTDVATVGSTGTVTVKAAGTTVITASIAAAGCYTAAEASYTLTVNKTDVTAYFDAPTTALQVGQNVTNALSTDSEGEVTYASSNTNVATVDAFGEVTAVGAGTARITANVAQTGCQNANSAYYDITITPVPTYNVTWKADGETVWVTEDVKAGASYSLPANPTNCSEERVFVGWTIEKGYESETAAASLITNADQTPVLIQDTTIYAVYADKETGTELSTLYKRISTVGELEDGDYLIVYEAGNVAFNGGLETLDAVSNTIAVTITNQTIESTTETDAAVFTLAKSGNYTIRSASGRYIGQNTDANGLGTSTDSGTYSNTISFDDSDGSVHIVSSLAHLRYNSTSGQTRFRYYKSGSYTNQKAIHLYKKVTTGSGTGTSYSNYSTKCGEKVIVTFHRNYGENLTTTQALDENQSTALTANPWNRPHYTFSGWALSADGEKVYDDGESVSLEEDIDLYALWTEDPKFTLTFKNGEDIHDQITGYAGEEIMVFDPDVCDEYTFVGWSTSTCPTEVTVKPATVVPSVIPAYDATYYAIFSREVSGGATLTDKYQKITDENELTTANYVIAAYYNDGYGALSTTWKDSYYLAPVAVSSEQDIITTSDGTIIWEITVVGNMVSIYNETAKYLYIEKETKGTSTYYNLKLGDNTTDNKFTYTVDEANWLFTSVTYDDRVLEFYTNNKFRWAFYTSADAPVYLYKQQVDYGYTTYYVSSPACSGEPADTENVLHAPEVRKLLINGQLFILRDGKIYTIQGARVQ